MIHARLTIVLMVGIVATQTGTMAIIIAKITMIIRVLINISVIIVFGDSSEVSCGSTITIIVVKAVTILVMTA